MMLFKKKAKEPSSMNLCEYLCIKSARARPPEIAPEKFSDSFGQNLLMINSHIMLK